MVVLWTTQDDDSVTLGDTVALGLVEHSNAIGRITAQTGDGRIQCLLISCENCQAGKPVAVAEDQLLLRVRG